MSADAARGAAEAVARRSYGKLVAFLATRTRDVAGAEDALSDAFAAALRDWPEKGCPEKPEAWLLAVARRKLIDRARRSRTGEAASGELQRIVEERAEREETEIPDNRLALLFACAHPAIEAGIRAPLMLQTVLGLDAATIASAFLASPAAMSKRLVRAKEKIRRAGIPFVLPEREDLAGRLARLAVDFEFQPLGVFEQGAHQREHPFAHFRQMHPAAGAVEQPRVAFAFERVDAPAQHRLVLVQVQGGPGDAAQFGDGDEGAPLMQVGGQVQAGSRGFG